MAMSGLGIETRLGSSKLRFARLPHLHLQRFGFYPPALVPVATSTPG